MFPFIPLRVDVVWSATTALFPQTPCRGEAAQSELCFPSLVVFFFFLKETTKQNLGSAYKEVISQVAQK